MGSPDSELSLLITDDAEIARYNADYRDRTGPTNVLAFAMQEGEFAHVNSFLLGDVVISAETAAREALENGISLETRLDELLVHGVLHLFGYDHEQDEAAYERMAEKSAELLASIRSEKGA